MQRTQSWLDDNIHKFTLNDILPFLSPEVKKAIIVHKQITLDNEDGETRHQFFVKKQIQDFLMDKAEKILLKK